MREQAPAHFICPFNNYIIILCLPFL